MGKLLIESFSKDRFKLEEAKGDNPNILGIFSGRFVVPGGTSRNGQYYSESHWPEVFAREEIQEKLKGKQMLGTVGHFESISDDLIRDLKPAISTFELNEDGTGKAYLLNTPVGQIVKTLAGAGTQFFVSSKGYGEVEERADGIKEVLTESFALERFDLVMEPGFLEAQVKLGNKTVKEAYQKLNEALNVHESEKNKKDKIVEGEEEMKDKNGNEIVEEGTNVTLLEKVVTEKIGIERKLDEALKELAKLKSQNEELEAAKQGLEKKISEGLGIQNEEWEKIKNDLNEENKKLEILLNGKKRMAEKVIESAGTTDLKAIREFFMKHGQLDKLDKALDENVAFFKKLEGQREAKALKELTENMKLDKATAKRLITKFGITEAVKSAKSIQESVKVKPVQDKIVTKKIEESRKPEKRFVGVIYGKEETRNKGKVDEELLRETQALSSLQVISD